ELTGEFDYRENYNFEFYATDLLQTTPASTFLLSSTEYVYLFHKNGADFKTLTEGKKRVITENDYTKVNYIDNQVIPTNEFLDGKRVYAYRYSFSQAITKDTEVIFDLPFASEIDYAWVDISNCYFDNKKNTSKYNVWCMGTTVGYGFRIGILELNKLYIEP